MKNPRIVGALFVGILLVLGAFLVRSPNNVPVEAAVAVASTPRTALPDRDSDGDGLRDWEEGLYGTNAQRADVHGDMRASSTANTSFTPQTMTERFAVDFFGKYFEGQATGAMDEAAQKEFIADAAQYAAAEASDRLFTPRDIVHGGMADAAAVRTYGNALAEALTKYASSNENEITILERALQSDNEAELQALKPIISSYANTLRDTLLIPVPQPFIEEHVALLNNLLALHNNVIAMQKSFTDALPAMVRFQRHPDDIIQTQATLAAIATRLSQYGITYSAGEPGDLMWNAFSQ